jgi:hypothetical protein
MSKYHSAEIWENKAEIWEKFIFCRIDMGKYVKIHKSGDMGKYRGDMKFPLLTVPISLAQHLFLHGKSYFWPKFFIQPPETQ